MDLKSILAALETAHSDHVGQTPPGIDGRQRRSSSEAITEFRRLHPFPRQELPQYTKQKENKFTSSEAKKFNENQKINTRKSHRIVSAVDTKNCHNYDNLLQMAKERLEQFLQTEAGKKMLRQVSNNSDRCTTAHMYSSYLAIIMQAYTFAPIRMHVYAYFLIITCTHQEGSLHGSEKAARAVIVAYLEEQICEILEGDIARSPCVMYIYIYAHVLVV